MTQPTQRQVDSDLQKSMDMFTRSQVGDVNTLDFKRPQRVLAALDGSSQDIATAHMTKQLAGRFECATAYLYVPASEADEVDATVLAMLKSVGATQLSAEGGDNYLQILAAAAEFDADLLIAPCPFGRDFESLGEDSTGTVIDVLTARWTGPLIAVRRPDAIGRDPTSHVRILLTGENPAAEVAAQWAVGLVQPAGRLELLLMVEESFYGNFREALQSIQPGAEVSYEDLENALAKTYGRLHASLQRTAMGIGFHYELLIRHEGDEQPITPEDPVTHPALMVLGLKRSSHDSQGEVQEFIRRSPHPVFVASVE